MSYIRASRNGSFSEGYADQNDRDYHAFTEAIRAGRLPVLEGVGPSTSAGGAATVVWIQRAGYTRGMDDYKDARFEEADFTGARFHGVNFSNVKISDAWLVNVDISGRVGNLSVNGVDVTVYVEAELNKRHPERLLLAPTDPDGMRNGVVDDRGASPRPRSTGRARCRPRSSTSR